MTSDSTSITSLRAHLDASVSPAHSVRHVARRLLDAGFQDMPSASLSSPLPESGFIADAGLLMAWVRADSTTRSFRIVGAHTDSPTLKIKPRPDLSTAGWRQLGIEVYGGILNNSWLDRDLAVAGRVVLDDGRIVLFDSRRPIARIPQLAIHLDRDVNESGLVLDKQLHLTPVWGIGDSTNGDFARWLAEEISADSQSPSDVHAEAIAAWDLSLYDVTPAQVIGVDHSLLASGRLDNQVSCWAATQGLIDWAAQRSRHESVTSVIALFDHEEVGSQSTHGASGPRLEWLLESLTEGSRSTFADTLARSHCLSVDNAHAVHPNYPERHEPGHRPLPNQGPVLKINANQRYASSAESIVPFRDACVASNTPHQIFVSRNSQPCGSTIGPITATRLGIPTVDIGIAQLSMHSARELCGVEDPGMLHSVLTSYLGGTS